MDTDEKVTLHDQAVSLAEALRRPEDVELIEAQLVQAWLKGKAAGLARAADIAKGAARMAS